MEMNHQSINEDRGARRAAELRRRFARVSNTSIGHSHFGLRPGTAGRTWETAISRRAQLQAFIAWSMLAGVVISIGFLIF